MNLRDLKYLIAIDQHRHFGKAAEASFVSQPALSIQIKKLERYLGVQLIERDKKQVMLTEIGKKIVAHAKNILQQEEDIKALAKNAKDPMSGKFTLGIIPTLAPYLLPKIIPKINKKFPKLELYLHEEKTEALLEKLAEGSLDAALLALPIDNPHLSSLKLFEEDFLLALPEKHPLAKEKYLDPKKLTEEKLLLLEEGHCFRDQALVFCKKTKMPIEGDISATSLETLRQMVIAKLGLTLLPKIACQKFPGLRYVSFSKPAPTRTIGLVFRKSNTARLPLLKALSAFL